MIANLQIIDLTTILLFGCVFLTKIRNNYYLKKKEEEEEEEEGEITIPYQNACN